MSIKSQESTLRGLSRLMIALVVVLPFFFAALPAAAQDDSSLGDMARKVRSDRILAQPAVTQPTEATRLAAELEQEQEEAEAAPEGFQSYHAEGYRVWVPSPFSVEDRDDNGVLLATPDVTGITTKVFVGTPIQITAHPTDLEFQALAGTFFRPYGSISCDKPRPGSLSHSCSAGGTLFSYRFSGDARLIEGHQRIIPVVCFATDLPTEDVNIQAPRTRDQQIEMGNRLMRNFDRRSMVAYSNRLCSTVLDSIRLKEDSARPHAVNPRLQVTAALASSEKSTDEDHSLGDIARSARADASSGTKAKISVQAEDTINAAPPGFRIHSEQRCLHECWEVTFFLPEKARQVKGGVSNNVYVLMLDDNTSAVFYFGNSVYTSGSSEYSTAQDLARRWVHAARDPAAKTVKMLRTINGRGVSIVRTGLVANMNDWLEEDANIGTEDLDMNIGCIARANRFADVESICATIYESWRLHK